MKKKTKKGPKKEVKRPAHKKPRPKKYVEAKIPTLPPVPTEQVPVTNDTPTTEPVQELPSNERLIELINVANEALAEVAKHAGVKAEHKKMLFDLKHLYEECPSISKRIDRKNLRFWFKTNKSPPPGVDINEEIYSEDLIPIINKMEKALSPQPVPAVSVVPSRWPTTKKSLWSKFLSLFSRKK